MSYRGTGAALGLAVSVALHALLFVVMAGHLSMRQSDRPAAAPRDAHDAGSAATVAQPPLLCDARHASMNAIVCAASSMRG